MLRNSEAWVAKWQENGAFWIHDGNPKRPHVRISSGDHSDRFVDCFIAFQDADLAAQAYSDLTELFDRTTGLLEQVDRVVGPAKGAITLAEGVARCIGRTRRRGCLWAFAEKVGTGQDLKMVLNLPIKEGERILLVEDVLTTGGSAKRAGDAVKEQKGEVLPHLGVLVRRTALTQVEGMSVVTLMEWPTRNWDPASCPLCAQGSEAISGKGVENWARLNAMY